MSATLPECVLEFLRAHAGLDFTADMLGSKFKVTGPTMRVLLADLPVRRTMAERSPRYYLPSEAQLSAERRAAEVPVFRPLAVTRERRELYERLAAERAA